MILFIFIIVLSIFYFVIGILLLLFPKYMKTRIEKMKNYEIRLTGLLIVFVIIFFVLLLLMNSYLMSILRNLLTS